MKKRILTIFLFLLSAQGLASVDVFLDRQSAYIGDIVKLNFETDFEPKKTPDFSALKKDFVVKFVMQGARHESTNGSKFRSYSTWTISLETKKEGQLKIPVIHFDNQQSDLLSLVVKPIPAGQLKKIAESIFIETEVGLASGEKAFVQQQIPLTLRLYSDNSVNKGDIHLGDLEHATIEKLTEDKQYAVTRDGKHFNVLERHFVIAADKSGPLVIPAPLFQGRQIDRKKSRVQSQYSNDVFNDPLFRGLFFGRSLESTKPITARGKPTEIIINPVPNEFKGKKWLPAEDMVIIDSWADNPPHFKVGEPTVRTLTIQASGLLGTQIPSFKIAEVEKVRRYNDKAQTKTQTDGTHVFGINKQEITYIPSASGKVTLPELSLDWWNTKEGKVETVTLPAREITILAGAIKAEEALSPLLAAAPVESIKAQGNTSVESKVDLSFLWWLLGSAIVLLLLVKMRKKARGKQSIDRNQVKPIAKSAVMAMLQQACESNNNKDAAQYLIQLAAVEWPKNPPISLGAIGAKIKNAATIQGLEQSLYASQNEAWQGDKLWNRVRQGLVEQSEWVESPHHLSPLYPH